MVETFTRISRICLASICGMLILPSIALTLPSAAASEFDDDVSNARMYRNPEERRDAGLGHQITDWFKVSGLLEIERESESLQLLDEPSIRDAGITVYNSQIALEVLLSETITAEINVEIEHESMTHTFLDEAVLIIDLEPLELEFGRLSLPFGEYYSHFTTGPALEIGETLAEGIVAGYSFMDRFEASIFALRSKVESIASSQSIDWGANFEYQNESESIKLGIGYLSDLAESDEQLLSDFNNQHQDKVGAWNAYGLFGFESFEITAEYLTADRKFSEFDAEFDKPRAWNIELAYFLNNVTQLSFRFEQSREIEEIPESQYGVNITWRPNKYALLSIEYLKGEFKQGFLVDDDDHSISEREVIAAQIGIEF